MASAEGLSAAGAGGHRRHFLRRWHKAFDPLEDSGARAVIEAAVGIAHNAGVQRIVREGTRGNAALRDGFGLASQTHLGLVDLLAEPAVWERFPALGESLIQSTSKAIDDRIGLYPNVVEGPSIRAISDLAAALVWIRSGSRFCQEMTITQLREFEEDTGREVLWAEPMKGPERTTLLRNHRDLVGAVARAHHADVNLSLARVERAREKLPGFAENRLQGWARSTVAEEGHGFQFFLGDYSPARQAAKVSLLLGATGDSHRSQDAWEAVTRGLPFIVPRPPPSEVEAFWLMQKLVLTAIFEVSLAEAHFPPS